MGGRLSRGRTRSDEVGGSWDRRPEVDERDAALIIAIEDYAYLEDVAGARQTGNDWESFLLEHRGIPSKQIRVLTDSSAYRESILREAREAAARVKPGGTMWVVYVGHGAPSKQQDDGLFVGSTANQTPDALFDHSVRRTELVEALTGPQRHTVMVVDACFSGQSRERKGERLVPGLQVALSNALVYQQGVTVLSAGRSNEFAGSLPGMSRPAFSYLLLGAMRGWADGNQDGAITTGEAVSYARESLELLVRRGRTQTPELAGREDLVLARGTAVGPDLRELLREPVRRVGRATATDVGEVDPEVGSTRRASPPREERCATPSRRRRAPAGSKMSPTTFPDPRPRLRARPGRGESGTPTTSMFSRFWGPMDPTRCR